MDDKKNLENHIEIDKWDKPDTNTDENVSGEEKMDEKSLKTQLSRAVLSSEEDGFLTLNSIRNPHLPTLNQIR